jgi:hypothetical protein
MSIFHKREISEKISSTLFDLTHLEINTIIKDEMSASKAPASPRLLLHNLAVKYDMKLNSLGDIYAELETFEGSGKKNFMGNPKKEGSGILSFLELRDRARDFHKKLMEGKALFVNKKSIDGVIFTNDQIDADIKMLQRIEAISNDVRNILSKVGVVPEFNKKNFWDGLKRFLHLKTTQPVTLLDFDLKDTISTFRLMSRNDAEKQELNLDLRQLMVIKKANDIGTEKVVLQTIIGIDGDITTRISQSFANQPVNFINSMHHEAIVISVKFWENLVNVVVKLGESIFGSLKKK